MIEKHKDNIISWYKFGQVPAKIIKYLRSPKKFCVDVMAKDVMNCIAHYTHELYKEQDHMIVLYEIMHHNDAYNFKDKRHEQNRLTGLLIMPKSGLDFAIRFPQVLSLDCTY